MRRPQEGLVLEPDGPAAGDFSGRSAAPGIFIQSSIKFSPWTYGMLISISLGPTLPSIEYIQGTSIFSDDQSALHAKGV
jgi:hypothetical protein